MEKRFRTQKVCKHNLKQAFLNTIGTVGTIYEIPCIKDICCPNQPERSKREDSQKSEMRCSEHCGNTVRKVQ